MAADPRLGNTGSAHDGAGTCTYDSLDIWTLEYFTGSRFYGYVRLDDYTMMGLRVGSWSSAFPLGCKFMEVHDGRLSQLFDSVIAMKSDSSSFHGDAFESESCCHACDSSISSKVRAGKLHGEESLEHL